MMALGHWSLLKNKNRPLKKGKRLSSVVQAQFNLSGRTFTFKRCIRGEDQDSNELTLHFGGCKVRTGSSTISAQHMPH
jgi:hypothetical protein